MFISLLFISSFAFFLCLFVCFFLSLYLCLFVCLFVSFFLSFFPSVAENDKNAEFHRPNESCATFSCLHMPKYRTKNKQKNNNNNNNNKVLSVG